jgi:hypothetical protein
MAQEQWKRGQRVNCDTSVTEILESLHNLCDLFDQRAGQSLKLNSDFVASSPVGEIPEIVQSTASIGNKANTPPACVSRATCQANNSIFAEILVCRSQYSTAINALHLSNAPLQTRSPSLFAVFICGPTLMHEHVAQRCPEQFQILVRDAIVIKKFIEARRTAGNSANSSFDSILC